MSQDPPRLGDDAASSELARALRALRSEHDDRTRVARVAERFGATLDAQPPRAGWLRTVVARRAKWLLLGGGAGLASLWMTRTAEPPARSTPPAATIAAVAEPGDEKGNVAVEPQADRAETAPTRPVAQEDEAQSHEPTRPRRVRTRAAEAPRAPTLAIEQPLRGAASDDAHDDATSREAPPPAAERAEARSAEAPRDASSADPRPRASSEFELLQEARRALAPDPRLALALLDEHEQRYPSGMLAPEREVLAIEALRALGRDSEAERRLAAFRTRYPNSLHLRRLERGAR
jgi:hypothetical protein